MLRTTGGRLKNILVLKFKGVRRAYVLNNVQSLFQLAGMKNAEKSAVHIWPVGYPRVGRNG